MTNDNGSPDLASGAPAQPIHLATIIRGEPYFPLPGTAYAVAEADDEVHLLVPTKGRFDAFNEKAEVLYSGDLIPALEEREGLGDEALSEKLRLEREQERQAVFAMLPVLDLEGAAE